MSKGVGIFSVQSCNPTLYQFTEVLQLGHRSLADIHWKEYRLFYNLPETNAIGLSRLYNLTDSGITNTSCRIVHNALKGFLIIGIGNQTEIGNHIFDLLTLIETQSTIDTIRNIILTHLFLERTALGIGAVKNGEITPGAMILTTDALDILCHNDGFLFIRIGRLQLQTLTMLVLREHILGDLSLIPSDQGVCRLHNQLCRTIILFQFEKLGILIL